MMTAKADVGLAYQVEGVVGTGSSRTRAVAAV